MKDEPWFHSIFEEGLTTEEAYKRLGTISIPSYLLTLEEFIARYNNPKSESISQVSKAYGEYQTKISHLIALILVNKRLDDMDFFKEEMDFFKNLTGRYFKVIEHGSVNEKKSEKYFEEQLREYGKGAISQYVIVQLISAIEVYFQRAFEEIFNDDRFISCYLKQENPHNYYMKKFFLNNGILEKFQKEYFLNNNKEEGMNFGSTVMKGKGISFQKKENIKLFLDIFFKTQKEEKSDFFNIMINNLNKDNKANNLELKKYWDAFEDIANARHSIIHSNGINKEIQDKLYDKLGFFILDITNIQYHILPSYTNIISLVDKRLFTYFRNEFDSKTTCIEPLTIDME